MIILNTIIGTLPVIVVIVAIAVRVEHRMTKVEINIEWLKRQFDKHFNNRP